MENEAKRLLFKVEFNDEINSYDVTIPEGSSALETIFGMAVIVKIFERDEIMSKEEALTNFQRYLNEPQYREVVS